MVEEHAWALEVLLLRRHKEQTHLSVRTWWMIQFISKLHLVESGLVAHVSSAKYSDSLDKKLEFRSSRSA